MNNFLQKPGIEKNQGDRLSYTEINALDNAIDSIIDVINKDLMSVCNINTEFTGDIPDMSRKFTLSEAIELIGVQRRVPKLIIKFLDITNSWVEYQFRGNNVDNKFWNNVNYWKKLESFQIIDGGTF